MVQRPIGILSILDEECKFPKSTDLTFLEKLHKNLEKTARYEKPRLSKVDFGVEHFAGKVVYNSAGFLDKNKDTLQDDLKNVCLSSSVCFEYFTSILFLLTSIKESLVRTLFTEEDAEVAAAPAAGGKFKACILIYFYLIMLFSHNEERTSHSRSPVQDSIATVDDHSLCHHSPLR